MISTQDIKNKEVINIYDGKSLGFVEDIEINLEKGTIEGIIVPEPRGFFSFFGRSGEQVIRWRDIKRIGDDVILVDVAGVLDSDFDAGYNRDYDSEGEYGGGYVRSANYGRDPEFGREKVFEPAVARSARTERDEHREQERSFDRSEQVEKQENGDEIGK